MKLARIFYIPYFIVGLLCLPLSHAQTFPSISKSELIENLLPKIVSFTRNIPKPLPNQDFHLQWEVRGASKIVILAIDTGGESEVIHITKELKSHLEVRANPIHSRLVLRALTPLGRKREKYLVNDLTHIMSDSEHTITTWQSGRQIRWSHDFFLRFNEQISVKKITHWWVTYDKTYQLHKETIRPTQNAQTDFRFSPPELHSDAMNQVWNYDYSYLRVEYLIKGSDGSSHSIALDGGRLERFKNYDGDRARTIPFVYINYLGSRPEWDK